MFFGGDGLRLRIQTPARRPEEILKWAASDLGANAWAEGQEFIGPIYSSISRQLSICGAFKPVIAAHIKPSAQDHDSTCALTMTDICFPIITGLFMTITTKVTTDRSKRQDSPLI